MANKQLWDLSDDEFADLVRLAVEEQYRIVKASGMATKTKVAQYLADNHGLDVSAGRDVMNFVESHVLAFEISRDGVRWTHPTWPEPK